MTGVGVRPVIRVHDQAGNVIKTHEQGRVPRFLNERRYGFENPSIQPRDLGALRRKENFACVRIFDFGSRRKTGDVDVTAIWRERTDN